MAEEIIAFVMALLAHQADITRVLQRIMDDPENIDTDQIKAEVLSAKAKIRALIDELEEQ